MINFDVVKEVIRYGTILKDEMVDLGADAIRIRVIRYKREYYWIGQINGEIKDFEKLQ